MLLRLAQRVLRERRWGDESVVFDTYSGETHYLNSLASAVYRRVAVSGSVDLDVLCAELVRPGDAAATPAISPEDFGIAAAKLRGIGLIHVDDTGT